MYLGEELERLAMSSLSRNFMTARRSQVFEYVLVYSKSHWEQDQTHTTNLLGVRFHLPDNFQN